MRNRRRQLPVLIGIWAASIVAIFAVFEGVERLWADPGAMRLIHTLHIVRGITASAVTTLLVAVYLVRMRPAAAFAGHPLGRVSYLDDDSARGSGAWLVQMRWVVILLVSVALFLAFLAGDGDLLLPRENLPPLLTCLLALVGGNLFFHYTSSRTARPYRLIVSQMIFDLVLLTFFLHFSGGLENPFFLVYVFHVLIAGILFEKRDAIGIAVLTGLLFTGLVGGEFLGLLHHSYIGLFPHGESHEVHAAHNLPFVAGRTLPFLMILAVTSYFTILLRQQLRRNQGILIQENKMAALGELTGRIAHEINNPIGVIHTKAKLLLEKEGLPEKVVSDLIKIDRHSERISEMTRGLLTFCRPSLGRKQDLNFNYVVESSLSLVESMRAAGPVRIEKVLHPAPPSLRGNLNELQQVVLNLVNNALDAMPEGGQLTLETGVEEGSLLLTVADTGAGIPPKILPRIFDPFFTTKAEGKGTGLGLSITHGLVKSHGGTIEVESREGEGTIFTCRFPAAPGTGGSR